MQLTSTTIAHYLIQRGFVSRESIVNGDFVAEECSRRNRNFKILRRNGPSYFVKQALTFDAEPIATIQREANCYWLWHNHVEAKGISDIGPRLFGYDRDRHILVLELVPGGETLREHVRRVGSPSIDTAAQLGRLLASVHLSREQITSNVLPQMFPHAVSWIFSIHEQPPDYFPALSAGNAKLLEIVKKYAGFAPALDAIKTEWQSEGLIHGDLKWDNCILHMSDAGQKTRLKLIDWEMADIGDPSWDVGSVLQAFLVHWILSLPEAPSGAATQMQFADRSLAAMQPAVRAFWERYSELMEFDSVEREARLAKAVRFGGARMIQSAFECLYYAPEMTPAPFACCRQV